MKSVLFIFFFFFLNKILEINFPLIKCTLGLESTLFIFAIEPPKSNTGSLGLVANKLADVWACNGGVFDFGFVVAPAFFNVYILIKSQSKYNLLSKSFGKHCPFLPKLYCENK